MKAKILAIFLALCMTAALAACSDGAGFNVSNSDSVVSQSDGAAVVPGTAVSFSDLAWNPTVALRQVLEDEGSMCGVLYLGYGNFDTYGHTFADDREYFLDIIKESGYADTFDFLMNVPDQYWVDTVGGSEFYLIIPTDEKARVEVNYLVWNEETNFEGETGESLYSSDSGAPFLLKCNYSDILPECEVIITDSSGEVLNWQPFISLRDGTVVTDAKDGKTVHDFTVYPEGIKEE